MELPVCAHKKIISKITKPDSGGFVRDYRICGDCGTEMKIEPLPTLGEPEELLKPIRSKAVKGYAAVETQIITLVNIDRELRPDDLIVLGDHAYSIFSIKYCFHGEIEIEVHWKSSKITD